MIPLGTIIPPHRRMTTATHIVNTDRVPVLAYTWTPVVHRTMAGCVTAGLLARGGGKHKMSRSFNDRKYL